MLPLLGCRGVEQGTLSWNAFLDDLAEYASNLSRDLDNQESYVAKVSKAARILRLDENRVKAVLRPNSFNGIGISEVTKTVDFQISLLCFGKGDAIPLHNHPQMTGVMLCASGSVRVRGFDLLGESPDGTAHLKHTGTKLLKLHNTDSLTAQRSNIHEVFARSPSQVIDIFSPPYNDANIEHTRWYEGSPHSELGPGDEIRIQRVK